MTNPEVRKDRWRFETLESSLNFTNIFAAALCLFLLVCVRPVYGWEVFVVPLDNNFGDVTVNHGSDPRAFKIYNTGSRDLNITHLSLSDNTNYSLNPNIGANGCESASPTIAAGRSCVVEITFHPISVGLKKAIFQITGSNSNESPLEADLLGRGVTKEDNEGDGLPDIWERQIVDADPNDKISSIEDVKPDDDFDGDGTTNFQEFNDGTNPINSGPNTSGIILQANAVTAITVTPQPEKTVFVNRVHDDANRAQSRISMNAGFDIGEELVLDFISDIYLNSLQVPVFALNISKQYFWPAAFADSVGPISARLVKP